MSKPSKYNLIKAFFLGTINKIIIAPSRIFDNFSPRVRAGISTSAIIFVLCKHFYKNDIEKIENPNNHNGNEFSKVSPPNSHKLPSNILVKEDKKSKASISKQGMKLLLIKKCYDIFMDNDKIIVKKRNSFEINIRESELTLMVNEHHEPVFDDHEDDNKFLIERYYYIVTDE